MNNDYINNRFFPDNLPLNLDRRRFVWGTPTIPDIYWNQYSYEEKIRWLYMQYQRLIDYMNEFVAKVNEVLEDFDRRITALETKMKELEGRVTRVEERVTELENRVTRVEERVTELENRVKEIFSKIDEINNRIDDLLDKIDNINNRLDEIDKKIEDLNTKFTELDNKYTDLLNKYNTLKEQVDGINIEIGSIKNSLDNFIRQVSFNDSNGITPILHLYGGTTESLEEIKLYEGEAYETKTKSIFLEELDRVVNGLYPTTKTTN